MRAVLLGLLLLHYVANGQNLVPNASFEQSKQVQCQFTTGTANISQYLFDWYAPTAGTADVWSAADALPLNCTQRLVNFETQPHTGRQCAGIYTYVSRGNAAASYREYIQVRLREPLKKGHTYRAEFFTALLIRFGNSVNPDVAGNAASNNLGMAFTEGPAVIPPSPFGNGGLLMLGPQVLRTDVLNAREWTNVAGCFVAQANYTHLTIGNFFADARTTLQPLDVSQPDRYAYYLIDDVVVQEVPGPAPLTRLGADTTLCPNQTITLAVRDSVGTVIRWQDGSARPRYVARQTGVYSVTVARGQCSVSDTVRVTVETNVVLPADTALCRGETLTLLPRHPTGPFSWSTGATDRRLSVADAGHYVVRVPSRYCTLTDTIRIDVVDCPGVPPNVFTPNNDGRNDTFVIDNITFLPWQLEVFDRWGRVVYRSARYANEWDGDRHPAGLYYYVLRNSQLKRQLKGWVQLIR